MFSCSLINNFGANVFLDTENVVVDNATYDMFAVGCELRSLESRSTIDASLKVVVNPCNKTIPPIL